MDEDTSTDRFKKLGFRPQKENVYNKLLPYSEQLDEESTKLFADIKSNLVKSVLAREMRPGCALWTSRLNKYMKIYGMKFSKEDHIALIKLFYELLTIPDLEPTRINKCATTLTHLLKKKYLISRDELELPWRPLYDLSIKLLLKSKADIGMYRCFSTMEVVIKNVVRLCRSYFPASATQEMLDEFRPKLCPFSSNDMLHAVECMEMFLPICVKPEEASISYNLWFEEMMNMSFQNSNACEEHLMWLTARLSSFNMGYINWEPYIPAMFTRFTRSLQLPVYYRQKIIGKQYKIDVTSMAIWITCTLNGDKNSCFFHLEKFMQTLESYYYSANTGRWTPKIRELLKKLAFYFVQRVYNERYKRPSWENKIPDHFKLTEEDIDRFVKILHPCVEQAMFSRQGSQDTFLCLQYLASLRANIIIPMIVEKLYSSMDSLTEPHKLTASMMGASAVARYMVQGARNNYPDGPNHILPLLMALLPGIDTNDIKKCLVTFNFIVHFVSVIPLIDSSEASKYYNDLTEEEHAICEATVGFEDFVLQFFDRLCFWVECNSLDFIRLEQVANSNNNNKNRAEVLAESALISVISAVLHQCSPAIFNEALKKVYNFVIGKIMEIQISGKMVAIICQGFAKVNPKETLKLFLPYLCGVIERLLDENPNIDKEEHLDPELLYNFQILSELVDARSEILNYSDRLTKILNRTLHMTSLTGSLLAARMLDVMMSTLTATTPTEFRSCSTPYTTHVKDFLSIREWGKAQKISDLKIDWYVPGPKEIQLVQQLLNKYLIPELEKLKENAKGMNTLSREELRRSLKIVTSIMSSHPVLPLWEEPAIQLVDSCLEPWAFNLIVGGTDKVKMPDGSNVRKVVADVLHEIQRKILATDEGDTKSIQNIVHIYNILLFNKSRVQDFEYHWKNFHLVKKLLEDRVHQNKLHLRHILINRVMLQQEFRSESRSCSFTSTHKQILLDLFELSVSRYSQNRIGAQNKLFSMITYFPYSYTILTKKMIEILKSNCEENHEKFKGCLYILISPKNAPIAARHDWLFIKELWPAIVRSMPSEKPSIVNLITSVTETIHRFFPTIAINLIFTESCLNAARLLGSNVPICDLSSFQKFIDEGEANLKAKCQKRMEDYKLTVDAMLDACLNGNLHWRYHEMAVGFIKDLVHYDCKYNVKVIKYFLQLLIHESLAIRKLALKVVNFILIQNKPKFKKIPLKKELLKQGPLKPGIREDNEWLLYNKATNPKNSIEWNEPRFVHCNYIGFYCWPKSVMIHAPPIEQNNIDKRFDTLTMEEKEIYDFFINEENIEKFIKYLSLEDKKGKDQFNIYKFLLFKELFKIFEDKLINIFLPHIEKLTIDKQESSQRCAAELISGLIRGTKHWDYDKLNNLWTVLIPLLKKAITNLGAETLTDWGLSMAMAIDYRDPNRCFWLLEFLMDNPLEDQTTLVALCRLHVLQTALEQQPWRNVELGQRLLTYFKPYLSQSFQNIRDKIASCLTTIYSVSLLYSDNNNPKIPNINEFFNEYQPILDNFYSYVLSKKLEDETNHKDGNILSVDDKKKDERLFKLIEKFLINTARFTYCIMPQYFDLLPLTCVLQNNDTDDEMAPICSNFMAVLSQATTPSRHMPAAINAMKKVAQCPFWSAKAVLTEFMSCFIFYNMATILSNSQLVLEFQNLVLELLEDPQLEVRNSASHLLSGLLHCQFIPNPNDLLKIFKQKSKTKLKKKDNVTPQSQQQNQNGIRLRHAGVLGLCAFINSHPYDVPDYMADIFAHLGAHLHDPQPIPATIRKTLGDFKRTHHENWQEHKLKFTEEELSILSDLTVPPSYYA